MKNRSFDCYIGLIGSTLLAIYLELEKLIFGKLRLYIAYAPLELHFSPFTAPIKMFLHFENRY